MVYVDILNNNGCLYCKLIKGKSKKEYLRAIEIGFDYYGLNGFYEMHKDVCKNPDNPWTYDLEILNILSYDEFVSLCDIHLNRGENQ